MKHKLLLLTAPFTQLNTPYPATAYLKGFLNTIQYESYQADLGIELILQLFSQQGLQVIFDNASEYEGQYSENSKRIIQLRDVYEKIIDPVILFLQNKNATLAQLIVLRSYLPEASRFENTPNLDQVFGTMGIIDKAKYLATLFIEDIGDLITECIDPFFGFSRYAEKLGMSASSFDELSNALNEEYSLLDDVLIQLLEEKISSQSPSIICISIPFPGNLYGSLRCGQYIKENYPEIKVILGGGYPNTELRSLSEPRIFNYCDYISLDDGEAPLSILLEYLEGSRPEGDLKRIFTLEQGVVIYKNTAKELDIAQREVGIPDYSDLILDEYLSVIEIPNPMHRLWSDGRWNKLTLAHGCYWGKCTFCDVSLDYIGRYEPVNAQLLCDRIEAIIEQTGENGFHFVDEAAPPALLRDLSLEIIKRQLTVVWWTNIRFEKRFSADLCQLMALSGCIAISAGLEVASDRLLDLIKKGVTVAQASIISSNFTKAGVMVHAYLMYGFPTQTDKETIDSLEMVRQLFKSKVLQSGYWHRFSLTAHSPAGLVPESFLIHKTGPNFEGFAQNDLTFEDPTGGDHGKFGKGLNKALYNYMHDNMIEDPLSTWFDFTIDRTSIPKNYIQDCISNHTEEFKDRAKICWIGNLPTIENKNGHSTLIIQHKTRKITLDVAPKTANWLCQLLEKTDISNSSMITYKELKEDFEQYFNQSFSSLSNNQTWETLRSNGLLILP